MIWMPLLEDDADTVSGRLLAALRRDIAQGRLPPGTKLPRPTVAVMSPCRAASP